MSAPEAGTPLSIRELIDLAKVREETRGSDGATLADGEALMRHLLADTTRRPDGALSLLVMAMAVLLVDSAPDLIGRPNLREMISQLGAMIAKLQVQRIREHPDREKLVAELLLDLLARRSQH
jgi:hypothetical protein